MFSAVRESGNKPIAAGTDKLYEMWDKFCWVTFTPQRMGAHIPRPRWRVDYDSSTGEVRHFKIVTDNESTPESVREDVRKAISEK